jgi:hypothetical protein
LPSVKPGRFKRVFQAGARLGDRLAIEFNRPKENETPIAELWRPWKASDVWPWCSDMHLGVLPTVVSPGAIWAQVEPGLESEALLANCALS